MLPRKEELSGILGHLYGAAVEPTHWQAFLRSVALAARGEAADILMHDPETQAGFASRYCSLNPGGTETGGTILWTGKALSVKASDFMVASEKLVLLDQFVRARLYTGSAARDRLPHGMFARIDDSASRAVHVGVYRHHPRGEFREHDLKLLRVLGPHLRRAHEIHLQVTANKNRTHSVEATLNQVTSGVILLNRKGEVIFTNRASETILRRNDGLTCIHGRLQASVPKESDRLTRHISEAAATSTDPAVAPGASLRISRRHGSALVLLVSPVGTLLFDADSRAAVIVFITDPDRRLRPPQHVLQSLFGLSPAESRVAVLLADGRSTAEISNLLGISSNTLKSQLASIFRKTGASRQAQAVRLLTMLAGCHAETNL